MKFSCINMVEYMDYYCIEIYLLFIPERDNSYEKLVLLTQNSIQHEWVKQSFHTIDDGKIDKTFLRIPIFSR